MKTRTISACRWSECIVVLDAGNIVAIPTDTVYGIAAMPLDARAIDKIYEAKGRPQEKALPMLVANLAAAERIAVFTGAARRLCAAFWPGALTVVIQARSKFRSPALADDGSVAVRMPASDLALQVIAAAGGVLAVTSANLSNEPAAVTAEAVLAQLDGRIDSVLDGGACPGGVASSVVRISGDRIEVLRAGALSREVLEAALRSNRHPGDS